MDTTIVSINDVELMPDCYATFVCIEVTGACGHNIQLTLSEGTDILTLRKGQAVRCYECKKSRKR